MTSNPPEYEDADPGLARVRTSLAWTRTALSFAAVGAVALRKDVIAGLLILATVPVIWRVGHLDHHLRFLYGKRANLRVALPPRYAFA